MPKYAVVTGGSSGLGQSLAERMAQSGYTVFALSRRGSATQHPNIHPIACDITDPASIAVAIQQIEATTSELDVLANCAGFGISGPIETTPLDLVRQQFEVNFLGTFSITQACLPLLRRRKGRILTISSVAATIPIPFQSFYSSTKSAITSWSLCLDNELRPYGLRALVVEPGDLSTGFTDHRIKAPSGEIYQSRVATSVRKMEQDERQGKSSDSAASYFLKIIETPHPAPRYVMGLDYKLFSFLYRFLPSRFSNYIIGRMYAR